MIEEDVLLRAWFRLLKPIEIIKTQVTASVRILKDRWIIEDTSSEVICEMGEEMQDMLSKAVDASAITVMDDADLMDIVSTPVDRRLVQELLEREAVRKMLK